MGSLLRDDKASWSVVNRSSFRATTLSQTDEETNLNETHKPCSFNGTMHHSFVYAQQVHFPSNPMQPGPIYFKTPTKCGIFGIMCEAVPCQVNYLIEEAAAVGKGANAAIGFSISFNHYF